MRPHLLKLGATAITVLATAGSAGYVGGHQKAGSAPLHPVTVAEPSAGGMLSVSAGVRAANVEPVTSTHAS